MEVREAFADRKACVHQYKYIVHNQSHNLKRVQIFKGYWKYTAPKFLINDCRNRLLIYEKIHEYNVWTNQERETGVENMRCLFGRCGRCFPLSLMSINWYTTATTSYALSILNMFCMVRRWPMNYWKEIEICTTNRQIDKTETLVPGFVTPILFQSLNNSYHFGVIHLKMWLLGAMLMRWMVWGWLESISQSISVSTVVCFGGGCAEQKRGRVLEWRCSGVCDLGRVCGNAPNLDASPAPACLVGFFGWPCIPVCPSHVYEQYGTQNSNVTRASKKNRQTSFENCREDERTIKKVPPFHKTEDIWCVCRLHPLQSQ